MPDSSGPVAGRELLLVSLDRGGEVPLHEQLERSLREDIRTGRLPGGARMPSTRGLAAELGVSRGVVTEAYGQLAAEGYLSTRQGAPVRVATTVRASIPRAPARSLLGSFAYHFHPGLPDLAGFPRDRWLRSLRTALRASPHGALGYGDPRGVPELREALGDYLGRARGTAADPEHVLICTGFTQGFSLACRTLSGHGVRSVALEDPGWHAHKLIVEQAGMEVVPVPIDAQGLRVQALCRSDADVVVVTPAHQFPSGAVLSPERRAALVEWAESGERLIVEDDYDGELRYDRGAVGALQGLAPERVLYCGSASKRLAPAMRLGWLLMPPWLAWQLIAAKAVEDSGSEVVGQLALCDFIVRGELDRHVRRMRRQYSSRREALLEALARWLGEAVAGGDPAGLYELVELPGDVNEAALLASAAERGVGAEGLSLHRFTPGGAPGLVLGYGNLSEPAIEQGVRLLGEALAEVRESSG
ncbi:MAG TPA: PLP-dependent aminotransferase family protein [Solirubrobacteraceae bacterium]|jgi:GntR family transcriptional regulator/MocR family aminotransferase|nr:PLP-dependent aminotransferase family protein [Solirubrobacteraceae bacterium]